MSVENTVPHPQLEYEDSFMEYAYEMGLWGLDGSNHQPSKNDICTMRAEFADVWINMHGFSDTIQYTLD